MLRLFAVAAVASATSVPLLEPFTLVVPNASIPNVTYPFNSSNLGTSLAFTSPSGRVITALPFLTQDFERTQTPVGDEVLIPTGAPYFAARFAPTEEGVHTYLQVGVSSGMAPLGGNFTCAGGPIRPGDGFARVAQGGAYFTLDNETAFWLVGENMAWAGCYPYYSGSCAFDNSTGKSYSFDRLLPKLAAVGGNWIRLWLGPSLVQNPTLFGETGSFLDMALQSMGVPFASYNLAAAWRVNHVVDLARALGIKITVVLEAQQTFDAFWNVSVYNSANGGPLSDASNLWASGAVVAEFEQRWDYIISRYGYSSSVFSWELQNEANDWPGKFSTTALEVQLGLLSRIQALDGYGHLVQSSFSGAPGSAAEMNTFESDPRVAFTCVHAYPNPAFKLPCDVAQTVWKIVAPQARHYGKPSFLEEFGASYVPQQHTLDPKGVGLRTGAWASLSGGGSGSAMQWFWFETDTLDTYGQLGGAATASRFLGRELLAANWDSTPGTFSPAGATAHAGWTLGRARNSGGDPMGFLAYAYNANFTQCGTSKVISAPTIGAVLTVPGLGAPNAGAPPLAPIFFNTTTGIPLPDDGGSATWDASGVLTLTFPAFLEDAAVYVNLTSQSS